MSEETVMKFKLATLFNILLGLISIVVTGVAIWVGSMAATIATHDRDIATLKESFRNQQIFLSDIKDIVKDVRDDQIRREKKGK